LVLGSYTSSCRPPPMTILTRGWAADGLWPPRGYDVAWAPFGEASPALVELCRDALSHAWIG
jgi:hypothetical protein